MATYQIKRIDDGPRFVEIAGGFATRAAAEDHFRAYREDHDLYLIACEVDAENDAVDYMATRGPRTELIQYAIEPARC
jgi:hypothetical protein